MNELLIKLLKTPYGQQKIVAKSRGIDWNFTFESWLDWWGDDIYERGRGKGKLVMARKGDTGPYSPENCIKLTLEENSSMGNKGRTMSLEQRLKKSQSQKGEKNHFYGKKHSEETKQKIREARATHIVSEETKQKMADAAKKRWANARS